VPVSDEPTVETPRRATRRQSEAENVGLWTTPMPDKPLRIVAQKTVGEYAIVETDLIG
jgi:hypothetical protein